MINDVHPLKGLACTLDSNGFKDFSKQFKGKPKLEQAFNKNKITMPHDTRGLVVVYGKKKDDLKSKQSIEENGDAFSHPRSMSCL